MIFSATVLATANKKTPENQGFILIRADRTGLEPATSAVTGRHSNQLNYRSVLSFYICLARLILLTQERYNFICAKHIFM